MNRMIGVLLVVSCLFATQAMAETISDFLIIKDIGLYKLEKPFITPRGQVVGGGQPTTSRDGNEAEGYFTSYTIGYDGGEGYAGPDVEISVYDSTQWLAHEIEQSFRDNETGTLGLLTDGTVLRKFDANRVYMIAIGGESFKWLSGNILVKISHVDLQAEKPEPLEVVKAYLQKYPSTISMTDAQLKNQDHTKQWIKEEFDRLLWASDRWVTLIQETDPKRKEKLTEAAENLTEFARYRRVYFKPLFSDPMAEDIQLLEAAHMRPDQEEFIRAKLTEYKEWWASHKSESISLP